MEPMQLDIDAMLRRLHLANTRQVWRELVARAEEQTWSYHDFLAILCAEEVAHRQQTRLQRLTRKAHFPFLKTIDDFDFTFQSTLRMAMLGSFLSPDFVTDGRCVIFAGKPGRGKTHLSISIAYRAIQNGFDARFVTCAALIDEISAASAEGGLRQTLASYVQPHVLIVDEVGYLSYGNDAANVLFHVVNERHRKKRSMIFTTNKSLKTWGKVLHDPDLAEAIIDRILERGRLIGLDGPSMRTRHLNQGELDNAGQPAIFSGTERPPFPEPTDGICTW
jgi:DNA replication protein DnaC